MTISVDITEIFRSESHMIFYEEVSHKKFIAAFDRRLVKHYFNERVTIITDEKDCILGKVTFIGNSNRKKYYLVQAEQHHFQWGK